MNVRQLEFLITEFNKIAKDGDRNRAEGAPYVVDVFSVGGGYDTTGVHGILSGTIHMPDKQTGLVRLDIYQYGPGTDWNACMIDVEAITAVRMRKPL